MRSKLFKILLRVVLVCAVLAVVIGGWLFASYRAAQLRYEHLAAKGVFAQRDDWGRVVQINRWPKDMADEDFQLLARMPRLKLFNATLSKLTDDQLRYVENIAPLEELILEETRVSDAGVARLAKMENLARVVVTPSEVTSAGLIELKRARPELHIVAHPLELYGMRRLADMGAHGELSDRYELIAIDLHDMKNVTDEDLAPIGVHPRVRMVNLSGTHIGNAGIAHLRGLKNLKELWLSGTNITDDGLQIVAEFEHLEAISLARTRIGDAGIAHLQALKSLRLIHAGDTQLTDAGLAQLQTLPNLQDVYVAQSSVTAAGADELGEALPDVVVHGGAAPEPPVEEIESQVLG